MPVKRIQVRRSKLLQPFFLLWGLFIVLNLFLTLLFVNFFQVASLVLYPFSRKLFRAFNRGCAWVWHGWAALVVRYFLGVKITVTGDHPYSGENAIVVSNHQTAADILALFYLGLFWGRQQDMKWAAKDPIKWVPGIGWGLVFLDCIFLKRDWNKDRKSVMATFSKLSTQQVPYWFVIFCEGTRITEQKLVKSQRYQERKGFPVTEYTMAPKTKGFAAARVGLSPTLGAVYDVTIHFVGGIPTMGQFFSSQTREIAVHLKRISAEKVPMDEDASGDWLRERFYEKDRMIKAFWETGTFPVT